MLHWVILHAGACLVSLLCVCECIIIRDDTQTTHNTDSGWVGSIGGHVWGQHLHALCPLHGSRDLHEVTSVLTAGQDLCNTASLHGACHASYPMLTDQTSREARG
jgi:hypothetical protein